MVLALGGLDRIYGVRRWIEDFRRGAIRAFVIVILSVATVAATTLVDAEMHAPAALMSTRPVESSQSMKLSAAPKSLQSAVEKEIGRADGGTSQLAASYSHNGARFFGSGFQFGVERSWVGRGIQTREVTSAVDRSSLGVTIGTSALSEIFQSKATGVEQTFDIARKPRGSGPLVVDVPISGLRAVSVGRAIDLESSERQVRATLSELRVVDARGHVIPATMRSVKKGHVVEIEVQDRDAAYPLRIDPTWEQVSEVSRLTGDGGAEYGATVAIDGNYAIVGSEYDDPDFAANAGAAFILENSGGSWGIADELVDPAGVSDDALFGGAVAISGSTVIVGASGETEDDLSNVGAAYVFSGSGYDWVSTGDLVASDGTENALFGYAVAISGNEALISGPEQTIDDVDGAGAAYVFDLSDGTWSQSAELTASGGGDNFGTSVAISGSTAVVGDGNLDGTGAAFVYNLSGGTWSQTTELTASDGSDFAAFGWSVSLSGDTILVGAQGQDVDGSADGAAYLFTLSDGTWSQSAKLTASDGDVDSYFGTSVALVGSTAIVGAPDQSIDGTATGAAYIFTKSAGTWTQNTELSPSDGVEGEAFGYAVAMSGSAAIVGAPDQTVDDVANFGTTYLYKNVASIPVQATLATGAIKASESCSSSGNYPTSSNGNYPVNCASGDFWHTFTDVSTSNYGPGLDLTRTYNSLDASSEGIFGYGWTSSYESSLTFNDDDSITVNEANGSQVIAEPNGDGGFIVPSWADSTLTANDDDTYTFVDQGTTTYTYNSSGQLTAITDPAGYSTTLTYSSGKLTTVTDSSGRTVTFTYGDNGLVSSVTDPMERVTNYYYDDAGNLTSVSDPDSNVTSFTYDDSHHLLTMTLPNGQLGGPDAGDDVVNTYSDSGQVLTQTDPMGNETTYSYSGDNFSADGGSTTIADPDGNVEVQDYVNGVMQSLTKGYGTESAATWSYNYDPDTLGLTQTTDPNENVTSATYDNNGNVLTSTDGLGNTTSYSYNSLNEVTCKALPLASSPCSELSPPSAITAGTSTITPPGSAPPPYVTYYEYDTDGNLIYSTTGDYAPGSDTVTQVRTTYDIYNGQSATLDDEENSCTTSAPATNLPCATIDADGVVTQLEYDSYGDLTSKSTPDESSDQNPGVISTVSGAPMGTVAATQMPLGFWQIGISTATIGGTSYAYVADPTNQVIRRINLSNDDETVVAGDYNYQLYDNGIDADGTAATTAEFDDPLDVATDSSGDLAIADTYNDIVWFIPATGGTYFGQSMSAGDVYRIAGDGYEGDSGNGHAGSAALLDDPASVAFDGSAVVIDDQGNNEIRVVPETSGTLFGYSMTAGDIYRIAGNGTGGYSGDGGSARAAEIDSPGGIAIDGSGDLFIADTLNNVIRFVPASSGTYFGQSMTGEDIYTVVGDGTSGYEGDGGAATSAELNAPNDVAVDGTSGIAVADTNNYVVRFIPLTSGTYFGQSMTADDIYTVAGTGSSGFSGDGGAATSADVDTVTNVDFDANGNLLMADSTDNLNQFVVQVVPTSSGTFAGQSVTADDIYTIAGTDEPAASLNGPASQSELNYPNSVVTDAAGDVYLTELYNGDVRFIPKTSGTYYGQSMIANHIYTIAGDGIGGSGGYAALGGPATSDMLYEVGQIAVDANGDIAIPTSGWTILFVPNASGTYFGQSMTADDIYQIAGQFYSGDSGDGGPATSALLNDPLGVAFDSAGDLIVADTYNNVVRFVPETPGTYYGQSMTADDIYTIAGNGTGGYSGDGGAATSAELYYPNYVAAGDGGLLISDWVNNVIRFIPTTSGTYFGQSMTANDIYTIAGNGNAGYSGDGGLATDAEFTCGCEVALDSSGNLLIADSYNDVIRYIPTTSGTYYGQSMIADDVYTIAGEGQKPYRTAGDGGPPLDAIFALPASVASDGDGGFYVADEYASRLRYVSDDAPASASTTTYTYDEDGEQTSMTAPNGNVASANAANFTTAYTYNDDGEVTSATQGGGEGATVTARTTDYGYDGDGNETSMTDPRGYATGYTYSADDEQTEVTNPDDDATLTCYDGVGNVAETVPAVGVADDSLTPASCPTDYPTDYGDRLATDATTFAYNALGEKTVVTSPAPPGLSGDETTTYAYDSGGRLTSVTAPPTSNSEDAADDVTAYTYDDANELLTTTTGYGTDAAATTSSCYDPDGEVTATVPGDGNADTVATCANSSPYDTDSGYQTTYAYDSLGELVTETAPETSAAPDGQVTTYTYDAAGNQTSAENPDGVTATKSYTPNDLLSSVSYSDDTPNLAYDYDADGNLTQMSDASGTTTSVYNPFDEETSTTNGASQTTSYTYDLDGDITGITYPLTSDWWADSDSVSYTYDDADQMSSVEDFEGGTSDVTPDADGLTSELDLGSTGASISTDYGANDETSSITLSNGSTLQEFDYSDAPAGNIVSETDTPSSDVSPADYTYDNQGRVISDTPGTDSEISYTEDANGNLTTLPTGASTTYDDASELTSSTLSDTTTDYTYDASGNRTAESGGATASATYNGASELTSYDNSLADMSTATYNGLGLRTSETSTPSGGSPSTQSFVWNTNTAVPTLLEDSNYAYIYGPSGTPFEQVSMSDGTAQYLVSDALGSVRGVVDSSGSLSSSTSYDAWGEPETAGGLSSYTPFGFAGGYTDSTDLSYLINRYYDPSTGSFFTVDPDVNETNQPYNYVEDDPVNGVDSNGLDCGVLSWVCAAYDVTAGSIKNATDFLAHHALQVAIVGGAVVATIATDGATSELLAEEIEVVVTEDGVSTTTTQIILESPSETNTVGEVAGRVSEGASAIETYKDCSKSFDSTCLVDLASDGVGATSYLGFSDAAKAWIGLGSTIPTAIQLAEEASKCS